MLDLLAPDGHGPDCFHAGGHRLHYVFMLPAPDAAFCAGGALVFDRTDFACGTPIYARGEIGFPRIVPVRQAFAGRTAIGILIGQIGKCLLAETAFGLGSGGVGSGRKGGDTDVLAGE